MRIFIESFFRKKLALEVESFDRVDYLKELLWIKEGTRRSEQTLAFDGRLLEDSKTLSEYHIQNDDTIRMILIQYGGWDVGINTFGEEPFSALIRRSDTVNKVKSRIQKEKGIPANEQRLFFSGQELDDGRRTLKNYGIKHGETIRLVRLPGHGYDAVDISAVQEHRKAAFCKAKGAEVGSKRAREESSSVTNDSVRDETKRLMQELVMERSTGASFLQSESGQRHISMLKRQAAKSGLDEFKVSADFKEIVMNRSMSVYDDVVKDCQRLLCESGRVSKDMIQLIDVVDSDQEEREGEKAYRKNLMHELDVERLTGSFFLQSEVGRCYIKTLQRQAAKSAVDELKKSAAFEEMVKNRAMSIYEDVVKECQRLLRESGRVSEDIIKILDHQQDDW